MKNETQRKWVLEQLEEQGFITRNQCLRQYISRLGAIICDLRKEGYEFDCEYKKTDQGKDYVYTLISYPGMYEPTSLFKIFK